MQPTYIYDSANRLTSVNGTTWYQYSFIPQNMQRGYRLPKSLHRLADALGSVRQLTDGSGAITNASSYDPYGVVTSTGGTSVSAYGYTGEQTDPSGRVYLRARYCAPNDGRFIARDSFSGYLNISQTQNPYIYSLNNPIRYTDPTGHDVVSTCLASTFSYGVATINYSASELVRYCRPMYNESAWKVGSAGVDCSVFENQRRRDVDPRTVWELFEAYVCEAGDQHMHFDGGHPLTRPSAYSIFLQVISKTPFVSL